MNAISSNETDWTITEPGLIALPATRLTIQWIVGASFMLKWNGRTLGSYGTLEAAKAGAREQLRQLTAMGMEP